VTKFARSQNWLTQMIAYENRRLKIAELYCQGVTLKEIAARLNMPYVRVSYALKKLMKEYNLKTHGQLGVWYHRNCKSVKQNSHSSEVHLNGA